MPLWTVTFDLHLDLGNHELLALVAKAHALAKVIREIPIPPGVQERIDRLNILRAVRSTTGIEGTELSETEVEQILAQPKRRVLPEGRQREELEVRNAERVMEFVAHLVLRRPDEPLTEELICNIHHLTTEGIDYPQNEPGMYRNHAVHAGTYVPPRTGEQVRQLMREFVKWFAEGEARAWDPAIRAIAAHFYVISIHPFGDGNGRASRAVESFLLYQGGLNARGFYSLANHYYRHRPEYVAHLDHVRFESGGNLTPFVLFALRGLVEELESVHSEVLRQVRIIAFRDYARETLLEAKKLRTKTGERMLQLLLGLVSERGPVSLTALRHGQHRLAGLYARVTPKTLSRDLNFLREGELICVQDDAIWANLDLMERYIPPSALPRRPPEPPIPRRRT
ncbi:MAG: Fic family protein [Candidatus Methylomirabilales bacterium]